MIGAYPVSIGSAWRFQFVTAVRRMRLSCRKPFETIFRSLDIAEEAIADGRHRGDVTRLAGVIPKQASQQRNAARKRVFGDRAIVPHRIQKLVFADQPMRTPKQEDQDSKSLRLDRQHLTRLNDAELAFSNLHIREGANKTLLLNHQFI